MKFLDNDFCPKMDKPGNVLFAMALKLYEEHGNPIRTEEQIVKVNFFLYR